MKYVCLFAALSFTALTAFSQSRRFIKQTAAGANNGVSWANAYTDLQAALQAALPGDTLWVAEGTYLPITGSDRTISFELKSGVRLYGGFAGMETGLDQRNREAHPTVLSGDIGVAGDSTDNSYTILYMDNPDSLTVLDGFIFRFGNAGYTAGDQPATSRYRSGGALYILADWEAYALIQNCRFEHNSARNHGGAVYVNGAGSYDAAPTFRDCIFEKNHAGQDGGAVARIGNSDLERTDFENCIFLSNTSGRYGGGLYYLDAEVTSWLDLSKCVFKNNAAAAQGGATWLRVGRENGSQTSVTNCQFQANHAASHGGLMLSNKAFLFSKHAKISKCFFRENSKLQIFCDLVNLDDGSSIIEINSSRFEGNPQNTLVSPVSIKANLFVTGDTVYNSGSSPFLLSGGKKIILKDLVLHDCPSLGVLEADTLTISNLQMISANANRGIINLDEYYPAPKFFNCTFEECVFNYWINGNDTIRAEFNNSIFNNCTITKSGTPGYFIEVFMNHCAFDDSTACDAPGFPYNTYCVSGNRFGLDPLFVDPDAGDFRLQPCSPLIDTGDNAAAAGISEDIGGQPRIQDGTVDMGAYESPAFGLAAEPAVAPACDSMATGAVSIPLAGACQPLTVFWQSGPLTGNSTDSLAAGFYVFTITDAKGRSVVFNAAVPSAAAPTLQADGTPISCFGASDATLSVSPLTGQEPFTYQWEPPVSTDSAAANLGPGPVSVTATDAGGCSAVFSFEIPEPDSLQFSATVQHASTQQSADGSILVNSVSGGTPPYHFLWEPGSSMEAMIGNLTPGFYTLRVTDERGCESVRTYEVSFTNRVAEAGGSHPALLIFPNPATDAFSLFWNGRQEIPVVIELYDGLGRQVRRTEVPPGGHGPILVRVPLEGLAPGYHRVLLRDAGGRVLGSGNFVKM